MTHNWIISRLGHGEMQCTHCLATNREIAAIGDLNHCPDAPALPTTTNRSKPNELKVLK